MGNLEKFIISLSLELIALSPVWWFIWFIMKRYRQQEKKIEYLVEAVNMLVHAHNIRNYKNACTAVEELNNQASLNLLERKRLEIALKTIVDFEKSYNTNNDQQDNLIDPQNN